MSSCVIELRFRYPLLRLRVGHDVARVRFDFCEARAHVGADEELGALDVGLDEREARVVGVGGVGVGAEGKDGGGLSRRLEGESGKVITGWDGRDASFLPRRYNNSWRL